MYSSGSQIDAEGNGVVFFHNSRKDWLFPFSIQVGEMLYNLRSGLDSCVYDAAILEFGGTSPPPDADRWLFPICETVKDFDNAVKRMRKLPSALRDLIESVQPYKGMACTAAGMKWKLGAVLSVLNKWSVADRHRRLNLVGTAISSGELGFKFPDPRMIVESCDFEVGKHLLEDGTEIARFHVRNYIPGTVANVNTKFTIEIFVDEATGKAKLQVAALTMGLSVSAVREIFESHYGIKR